MTEVIKSLHGLRELAEEWNLLPGACQHPLLRYEWFLSCAASFHPETNLRVVVLRDHGRIRAIAPLVLVKRRGIQRLEILGSTQLYEPSGLLYDNTDSLEEICSLLTQLRYPIILQRLVEAPILANHLGKLKQHGGKLFIRSATRSPYIEIETPWEEYYNSLSSRRRYDYRRAHAKLERSGKVSVDFIHPSEEELEPLLTEAFRIEASGWKGRAGTALQFNLPLQRFLRAYALLACRLGILRLSYLKVNNKIIAMQIGVEYADCYWVLKVGYDENWASCSPGMQLTMEAVKYVFNGGLRRYEFLGGDEPWLRMWTAKSRAYTSFLYYPFNSYGLTALCGDAFNSLTNRFSR